MGIVFELKDCTGRLIRLTDEAWHHVLARHPEFTNLIELQETLARPFFIRQSPRDSAAAYYHRFNKNRKMYALVVVKYLNGHGFVITAFYARTAL